MSVNSIYLHILYLPLIVAASTTTSSHSGMLEVNYSVVQLQDENTEPTAEILTKQNVFLKY